MRVDLCSICAVHAHHFERSACTISPVHVHHLERSGCTIAAEYSIRAGRLRRHVVAPFHFPRWYNAQSAKHRRNTFRGASRFIFPCLQVERHLRGDGFFAHGFRTEQQLHGHVLFLGDLQEAH